MKQIQKYTKGELPEAEMEKLTEKLIEKHLDQETKERWAGKLADKEIYREGKNSRRQGFRIRRLRPLLAAASVAILISLFFLIRNNQPTDVRQMAGNYLEDLNLMTDQMAERKSPEEDAGKILKYNANKAFGDKNYAQAISQYEQLIQQQKADHFDLFYYGCALLLSNEPNSAKAIDLLKESRGLSDDLEAETDWVLALAYLHNGQVAPAKSLLEKIVSKQQYMDEEAAKLLEAI
ncbi:MAG: hypothetical protein GYB31_07765 [Bacteroidetes bacterium]|nr:hypothetical protein [Bacteroidota bacterium]